MTEIKIMQGDITKQTTDVIVNAANTSLLGGSGVDGAIHRAAGPELLAECKELHGCRTGEAKLTQAYRLPCRFVIHTPGPIWRGGDREEAFYLANCYRNCLRIAVANGCKSISFPSISTGVYKFPLDSAAQIAIQTIKDFVSRDQRLNEIVMVCFDPDTQAAYEKALAQEA